MHASVSFARPLVVAVLLGSGAMARADIITFTDRAAFLAAVSNPATDTFDDLVPLTAYTNLDRHAGAYTYSAAGSAGVLYGAGSAADPWLSTNWTDATITFTNFSAGVNALGGQFFGTDLYGNYTPNTTVTLVANDGTIVEYTIGNATTDSFVGFVSSAPLLSVTLKNGSGGQFWPTANNLVLAMAAPVPEPGQAAMLWGALPLLCVAARRRRRR